MADPCQEEGHYSSPLSDSYDFLHGYPGFVMTAGDNTSDMTYGRIQGIMTNARKRYSMQRELVYNIIILNTNHHSTMNWGT
ncbi:hypothetical protein CDAR_238781 [Caerostris darwini]|uniref:Uncharacterized protein n=1 Tax=Caerostris darwini TaxID=1538125 RepID=A0AAV4PT36_9ARAC|nr:hypothetical protein CDAR_238781 [Caerostris darwini]